MYEDGRHDYAAVGNCIFVERLRNMGFLEYIMVHSPVLNVGNRLMGNGQLPRLPEDERLKEVNLLLFIFYFLLLHRRKRLQLRVL